VSGRLHNQDAIQPGKESSVPAENKAAVVMMMTTMVSVDRDDKRIDYHKNNNDKSNTSTPS
jgi:hypothetical protein